MAKGLKSYKIDIPTAGTRVALSATITAGSVEIVSIRGSTANTGLVYVGGSNVSSSNGYGLSPSERINLDSPSDGLAKMLLSPTGVYFDAATSGNDVEVLVIENI